MKACCIFSPLKNRFFQTNETFFIWEVYCHLTLRLYLLVPNWKHSRLFQEPVLPPISRSFFDLKAWHYFNLEIEEVSQCKNQSFEKKIIVCSIIFFPLLVLKSSTKFPTVSKNFWQYLIIQLEGLKKLNFKILKNFKDFSWGVHLKLRKLLFCPQLTQISGNTGKDGHFG